jgi:hypothetical protein
MRDELNTRIDHTPSPLLALSEITILSSGINVSLFLLYIEISFQSLDVEDSIRIVGGDFR